MPTSEKLRKPLSDTSKVPVLVQTTTGWTIHLSDSSGNNVLNLAVFPHKFLAEEALKRLMRSQGDRDNL